jgi:hypothetical protein
MLDDIVIECATVEQFASMKDEWTQLLDRYDDATLFNTWEWQYTWWETWGNDLGGELYLILARNKSGVLMGVAPMYRYKYHALKGMLNYYKVQLIGSSASMEETVRSEYLDFIYVSNNPLVVQSLWAYIYSDANWSKVLLPDIRTSSVLFANLTNKYFMDRCYVRATLKDVGVRVDTTCSFELYKKGLGKNTRLDSFNRRKRLENSGEVLILCGSKLRNKNCLSVLNAFHDERWGKYCFDKQAKLFHQKIVSLDAIVSGVEFCEILLDDEPVSIIYNIDYKGVRYNIQLGFTMLDDKKLSMGSLQLGYAIEDAFNTKGINYFDFLAGAGKNSFYKQRFKGNSYRLYTLEVIRSPVLRFIYRLYDMYKSFVGKRVL